MRNEFLSLVPVYQFAERYADQITDTTYFGFPLKPIIEAEKRLRDAASRSIAYLSMEYGLATSFYNTPQRSGGTAEQNRVYSHEVFSNMFIEDFLFDFHVESILDMPIYSGGLGVLAGDTLKSASDLQVPLVATGILWEKGYFKQNFWFKYGQVPDEMDWDPSTYPGLIPLDIVITLPFKKESVSLRLWKYYVYSHDRSHVVPLILLDARTKENSDDIQRLTDRLYRSQGMWIKLMQRSLLGMGAVQALEACQYAIDKYHLNEGHAAMAFVEKVKDLSGDDLERMKNRFIYTCHTPVAAGHDRFSFHELDEVLPDSLSAFIKEHGKEGEGDLANLTLLLMKHCQYVNAVSKKHQYVTQVQFPQFKEKIQSVTNGIHMWTWLSDSFRGVLTECRDQIGDYAVDPTRLKNIITLKDDTSLRKAVWQAHQENKRNLVQIFHRWHLREDALTICWARRIAQYKRPSLIFQDAQRLRSIARDIGPLQIIIAGKAHPADNLVGTYIAEMMQTIDNLGKEYHNIRIIMLENYDAFFGKLLTSSVDIWLNNPLPPFEASGTSGMKAMLNGVLQLTTSDGWVVEVKDEPIGKIFGYDHAEGESIGDESNLRLAEDSQALYQALEELARLYYETMHNGNVNYKSQWIDMMIHCIAQAGFFNTHRMVQEYRTKMWVDA